MVGFKPAYGSRSARFRAICNGFGVVLLLFFIYDHKSLVSNRFMGGTPSVFVDNRDTGSGFWDQIEGLEPTQRRFLEGVDASMLNGSETFDDLGGNGQMMSAEPKICSGFYDRKNPRESCDYLITHQECFLGGLLNYIKFFYCDSMNYSSLRYIALGGWILVLFYLLGNTAADYFCCSLEKLSDLLKLSPTVAGVSLLPLGNGAPDVFASIAAFVGTGSGELGLNSVLGGGVFVVCIVVGVVSLSVSNRRVQIDRICFIRDLCFFMFAALCLIVIVVVGEVSIAGAIAFLSLYVVYGFSVAFKEVCWKKGHNTRLHGIGSLLPVAVGSIHAEGEAVDESLYAPLLNSDSHEDTSDASPKLPHWIWASNVAIYSDYIKASDAQVTEQSFWTPADKEKNSKYSSRSCCSMIWWVVEMPLTVPRRLTIPIVEEERWSKWYAVASASLSPVLLAFLWSTQGSVSAPRGRIGYLVGVTVGFVLGALAFICTKRDHPPRKFILPWVLGGFFMSVTWFYIIANELVTLLVSLGVILGISPSLLASTILAWGNSMGDLVSNTALALNERDGVQIAMSGCYAGPMFNMVVGLGISMVLGAWSGKPEPYMLPKDSSLYYTIGFLMLGLIWALIVLPQSDMKPNKILGIGLIVIYLMFLCLRVGTAIGVVSLHGRR